MHPGAPLQLFPAPQPKAANPQRKRSRRNGTKPVQLVERSKSPTPLKEIVIQVSENKGTGSSSSPVSIRDALGSHPLSVPAPPTQSRAESPASIKSRSGPAAEAAPSQPRAPSPALSNGPSILSGSATLVRSNSDASSAVPMRSIFPRYNPALPLTQQNYRPTQLSPTHIARQHISKEAYSPSLYSTQSPGHPGSPGRGCLSAPSAITSFPTGVLGAPQPRFSSQTELQELWEAANGQVTKDSGRTFALKMTRDGSVDPTSGRFAPLLNESFVFGTPSDHSFYDFQTLKTNYFDEDFSECHIRRRDPKKGTVIPIMALTIEPASRRESPEDGLVTNIFPKIAEIMALDSACSKMAENMSPEETEKIKEEAVRHTAKTETCKLFWDHDSQRYYLLHPGLNQGKGHRFTIHTDRGTGFDVPGARGTIRLVDSSSHATLASLEFGTATLLIDTTATSKIASFYMLDVAVSAIITVALIEGRKARLALRTAGRPLSPPPPAVISPRYAPAQSVTGMAPSETTPAALEEGVPAPAAAQSDLPKPAQGILGVLVLTFQSLVWLLSVVLGAMAAMVVSVTACCQKKK